MEDWEFEADIALRLRCADLAIKAGAGLWDSGIANQIFKWVTREGQTEDEPTS